MLNSDRNLRAVSVSLTDKIAPNNSNLGKVSCFKGATLYFDMKNLT